MKKTKNLVALVFATAAIFMSSFSVFAWSDKPLTNTTPRYNPDIWNYAYLDGAHGDTDFMDGTPFEDKISDIMNEITEGGGFKAPGWKWVDGYCYYIADSKGWDVRLKNCTTPDGYTVDEEGRWTVNGVPQRDTKLGHQSFWTGRNIYASDNERWDTIRKVLYQYWRENSYLDSFYDNNDKDMIRKSWNGATIQHKGAGSDMGYIPYLTYYVDDMQFNDILWQHAEEALRCGENMYDNEMCIKAILGDNEGQRLFDYLMSLRTTSIESMPYDTPGENGELVWAGLYLPGKVTHVDYYKFDASLFTGRTTDYGKIYDIWVRPDYNEMRIYVR